MALKDLKSDLSKFRRPVEKPLVEKKRVNVPKSSNQTPLSQFVDNTPNAPKSKSTTPKQGVTPTNFDNSSNFLGETTPAKFDNSSKNLGETTPTKMSLAERFLGETEPNKFDNSSNNLGETTPSNFDNSSNFLGETEPKEFRFVQQFLGQTTPGEFTFVQKFLGETSPSNFDNRSNFLGETSPSNFDNESNFLGETSPSDFDNSSKFLGETTPSKFVLSSNKDAQAVTPSYVNFIVDDSGVGFSPFQQPKDNSKFVGVDRSQTKFDNTNSLLSQFGSVHTGISFQAGYGQYKVGDVTGDTQKYSPDGKRYIDSYTSIGSMMEQRRSPSFLDEMYAKFNLKDDAANRFSLIKAPYILRGIQRRKITKGEPQQWGFGFPIDDGLIRGGLAISTERALVDVARMGSFFLSVKGLLWGVRQVGLQRSQRYGKTWTPVNLLANIATQHAGLKFDRPGVTPKGDETWKYNSDGYLEKIYDQFKVGLKDNTIPLRVDERGGFDSVYGIGVTTYRKQHNSFFTKGQDEQDQKANFTQKINPFAKDGFTPYGEDIERDSDGKIVGSLLSQTENIDDTFRDRGLYKSDGLLPNQPDIADYEAISYGKIQKIANSSKGKVDGGDFRTEKEVKYSNNVNPDGFTNYEDYNLEKTYGTAPTFKTNQERLRAAQDGRTGDWMYDQVYSEMTGYKNDLVHLYFTRDNANGTQKSELLQFRSTISGVTETFSPSWNSIKYPGRADKAYMYSEFERTLSFNFKTYASSRSEMKVMWQKLSELSKMTMPTYEGGIYSGHICYFRLGQIWGNGSKGVPTIITSLTYTIPDDLPWDLNHDALLWESHMCIDVSIGLTILPETIYKSTKNHYSFYETKAMKQ